MSLHAKIMNLPLQKPDGLLKEGDLYPYKCGHRDARHAAAELALEADAEIARLRDNAARYELLRRGQHWSIVNGIGDELRGTELDAAIEAAMAPKVIHRAKRWGFCNVCNHSRIPGEACARDNCPDSDSNAMAAKG